MSLMCAVYDFRTTNKEDLIPQMWMCVVHDPLLITENESERGREKKKKVISLHRELISRFSAVE